MEPTSFLSATAIASWFNDHGKADYFQAADAPAESTALRSGAPPHGAEDVSQGGLRGPRPPPISTLRPRLPRPNSACDDLNDESPYRAAAAKARQVQSELRERATFAGADDGSGKLDVAELKALLKVETEEEAFAILRQFDHDGDGELDLAEFGSLLARQRGGPSQAAVGAQQSKAAATLAADLARASANRARKAQAEMQAQIQAHLATSLGLPPPADASCASAEGASAEGASAEGASAEGAAAEGAAAAAGAGGSADAASPMEEAPMMQPIALVSGSGSSMRLQAPLQGRRLAGAATHVQRGTRAIDAMRGAARGAGGDAALGAAASSATPLDPSEAAGNAPTDALREAAAAPVDAVAAPDATVAPDGDAVPDPDADPDADADADAAADAYTAADTDAAAAAVAVVAEPPSEQPAEAAGVLGTEPTGDAAAVPAAEPTEPAEAQAAGEE